MPKRGLHQARCRRDHQAIEAAAETSGDVVEKELLEQIKMGILERVDQRSGPTPWVFNMVIVPKDKPVDDQGRPTPHKSVQITVDSKAVNKCIRRTRYPSKTIDDLVVQANGAVVFSKIDITKVFHQIELHRGI